MAEADGEIIIAVELDDGSIKKVKGSAEDLAKKIGGGLGDGISKGVDKSLTGIITQLRFVGDVAGAAFRGISSAVSTAVAAAAQQEQAVQNLNTALRNAGEFSAEASIGFQEFASALQQTTRFGDEVILQQAALARNFVSTNEEAKELTAAAIDLSEATGISLDSAVKNLGKTYAGLTGELGESVPALRNLTAEQLKSGEAVQLVADLFGGSAARNVRTFGGASQQLANIWGDVQEVIGGFVTDSPAVVAVMNTIGKIMSDLSADIKGFGKDGGFNQLVIDATRFGETIAQVVLPPLEVFYNASIALWSSVKTGLQGLLSAFAEVAAFLAEYGNKLGLVSDEDMAAIKSFASGASEVFTEFAAENKLLISGIFDVPVAEKVQGWAEQIAVAAEESGPLLEPINENLKKSGEQVQGTLTKLQKKIGPIIKTGIVNLMSQSIQSLARTLVQGGDAFAAFSKTVVNILGDLMIQVGTAILTTGVSIEALQKAIVTMFGGQAIAAGIAMIALGAAMKAFVGGGGGATTPSVPSTDGGSPATQDSVPTVADPDAVERDTRTEVKIEVKGDILDRQESGLAIAEVLEEYFNTSDGVLTTA